MTRLVLQRAVLAAAALIGGAASASGGFAGTDVILCLVGRKPGVHPSNWYTQVWAYNPNGSPATVTYALLQRGQANLAPPTFTDTLAAGETKSYENAVWTMFGLETFGAIRATASARVVINERFYSVAPGATAGSSVGQSFAGVPAAFAIGLGESTSVLGAYQTQPAAGSSFRYNFGGVEAAGAPCRVRFTASDSTGVLGTIEYSFRAYEPRQYAFKDAFPGVSTTDARVSAEVISGTGKVIVYGSGIANESQDPATAEMQFADALLAAPGPGGVATVTAGAGLTGGGAGPDVTLSVGAGAGITVAADTVSVAGGGITSDMLAADSVTSERIADGGVLPADVAFFYAGSSSKGGPATALNCTTCVFPEALVPGVATGQVLMTVPSGAAPGSAAAATGMSVAWGSVAGDVTAVNTAAGSGLTGGVTSGDANLAIAPGGVTGAMLAGSSVTGGTIADGAVAAADVAFNYAGAASKGGAASDLACSGCVAPAEVAPGGDGQILTTSGGVASWQAAPGGLTLPYAGSVATSGTAASITNTGSGRGLDVTTDTNTAIVGIGNTGGFFRYKLPGYGEATLGGSTYGVGAFGKDAGALFQDIDGSGMAFLAYGHVGIDGRGNQAGGVFSDLNGSGDASVGSGDIGIVARGNYAGGTFADENGTGAASVAFGDTGIDASGSNAGTRGQSGPGTGAVGASTSGVGVLGTSSSGYGVQGWSTSNAGVYGRSDGNANGVKGVAFSSSAAVLGQNDGGGTGVEGTAGGSGTAVHGLASGGYGVYGSSTSNFGAYGHSATNYGVYGSSNGADGVVGRTYQGTGGASGVAGIGQAGSNGLYGVSTGAGYAAWLNGKTYVGGFLTKAGGGFKIDHPLDPERKYLYHSFVESPDMKNLYDGVVELDHAGEAVIELPEWFEALNGDFRYQLTAIGEAAPSLYVAEEVHGNRFRIAGGYAGMRISWQVTGTRRDRFAEANRLPVEEDKPEGETGTYLHPQAWGRPAELGIEWSRHPELMRLLQAPPREQ